MSNFIITWVDDLVFTIRQVAWLANNNAAKSFFPSEPKNNIDQFDIPPWFKEDDFYDACIATYGDAARKIVGDRTQRVTASYFVIHDTSGGKEPNTANVDAVAATRGIHLFLGTERTVYRPHKKAGIENDWHTVGWGTRVGNKRAEEFVHTELSPYNNYEVMNKEKYREELSIGIDGVINSGSNFTIRQYDRLAIAYLICSLRRGRLLTVTTHREVDFSYSRDAHGDPQDFDFDYFYELIASFLGLGNVTFGIQRDRALFHNQINLDGYVNEFWPFVNKEPGVFGANQYGRRKKYPGNPNHLYVSEK
jgi:N-acetylmuramoyl-L-alanine amidase